MRTTRVKKATKAEIIADILAFIDDESKSHRYFSYGENKLTYINGKNVVYYQQMKIIFEGDYFHWKVQEALDALVDEGEIVLIPEGGRYKFFIRKGVRYYNKQLKEKLALLDWLKDTDLERAVGKYGEQLTRLLFAETGFRMVATHTNAFGGKKWKSKRNLDFIFERNGLNYGIEVKNQFTYIEDNEFQEKMFDVCDFLGLIPVFVARYLPQGNIDRLREHGGFTIPFKRKAFPLGFEAAVKDFYLKTMLPVGVTEDLVGDKKKQDFLN